MLRLELRRLYRSFNAGKEHYQPSQVQVSNGTAKLVAEPLSPPYASGACYQGQCTYKAGLVSTARPRADNGSAYLFPFTYGYIESRMKFPGTPGFFTAFWMLPTDPSFNYDRDRYRRDPRRLSRHDLHDLSLQRSQHVLLAQQWVAQQRRVSVKDYSADWVSFGLDWQPTYIAWYIDGVKCGQFNGNTTTIENGPMQLILHMMIDNQWERDWGSVYSQTLVRQLEVDYIRIYQQQ